ncbi:MAG: guanylate kinase [Arenicella sp.]|nr:guanylate kinase [Arenicella sp.]
MNTGNLFIVSAPSGAGKTSLAKALIASSEFITMSVSHTTRTKRGGEVHGEDYFFVDQSEFQQMVEEGVFLEYAEVYGNYYGTSSLAVDEMLTKGLNVLLDIDWQGARRVRKKMPDAVSISVLPPSIEELERRLRSRGSDSEDVIQSRMQQALSEMAHCKESDFAVLNDDFNTALSELSLIVAGQGDRIRPLNSHVRSLMGIVE